MDDIIRFHLREDIAEIYDGATQDWQPAEQAKLATEIELAEQEPLRVGLYCIRNFRGDVLRFHADIPHYREILATMVKKDLISMELVGVIEVPAQLVHRIQNEAQSAHSATDDLSAQLRKAVSEMFDPSLMNTKTGLPLM